MELYTGTTYGETVTFMSLIHIQVAL
jgi:hypothetical protein